MHRWSEQDMFRISGASFFAGVGLGGTTVNGQSLLR